ncbi:MAG TPA: tRNA (adenosine(37)-N6)-dimethylallyltransferase MiaA [Puia sp.]|nr:tRNA (adenosine(37)-N6)-dimethylallyltransferase MiaA [Puia sp.]
MKNKTVIIITGPTAVGKTAVAVQLAQHFHTKIISADSRQCFKELNIGVAKPSEEELQTVQHYFINSHSIHEEVNAALFEQLSLQWVNEIFKENDTAVMVGGTGLYIKAFCEGFDEMPVMDNQVRTSIREEYEQKGMLWLQETVKAKDAAYYKQGEIQNPHRLMRALEVKISTGRSILEFRSFQKKERPFNIKKIGLELSKEELNANIDPRVDMMIDKGLIEEAKKLIEYRKLNALQTVGYKELFDYFNNESELNEAIALIKKNTRHYAKRQMTWFRKDNDINWVSPHDPGSLKKITQS